MNLTAFQQSAFLQSLGWAIANSVWQGGILWIIYQIIVSSYTNASAKFKNNTSTILLFITFLWFVITFFAKFVYLENSLVNIIVKPFSSRLYSSPGSPDLPDFVSYVAITLPYLSVAYLFLLLIFTIKLINSYHNTNVMRHRGLQKPPVEWRLFVDKVTRHIGIHKKIKLWFSMHVDVPATIGFLKPVILIPVASLNQLTQDQLEAIILHELSHIKRNDYLINIFISLIETILFFNPFVALMSKIIKKERENCCDDFVLQYQYDRHSYASALLCLEKYRNQHFRLALTATSGKKQLLLRIKRIMDVRSNSDSLNYGQKLLALLLVTGIICSIAWLSPAKKADQHFTSTQIPIKPFESFHSKITKKGGNILLKLKPEQEHNIISAQKNETIKNKPVIDEHVALPENNIEEEQDNWFSFNFDDKEGRQRDVVRNNHTQERPAINYFVPSPHMPPDSDFLHNMSFSINLDNFKADIEKSNELISSINWDKINWAEIAVNWDNIQQGIFKRLEKINIPDINIDIRDHKTPAPQYKLEKVTEKKMQKEFQLLNECNDKRVNMKYLTENLLRHPGFSFSYSDNDEDTHRKIVKIDNLPVPRYGSQKSKAIAVVTDAPSEPVYSKDNNSEEEVTDDKPFSISDKNSPENMVIDINYNTGTILIHNKKTSSPKKSGSETLTKKLLTVINKKISEIRVED